VSVSRLLISSNGFSASLFNFHFTFSCVSSFNYCVIVAKSGINFELNSAEPRKLLTSVAFFSFGAAIAAFDFVICHLHTFL